MNIHMICMNMHNVMIILNVDTVQDMHMIEWNVTMKEVTVEDEHECGYEHTHDH